MKRGYIFSVDAIIAVVIIFSGAIFISMTLPSQPDLETPRLASTDLMSLLFDVRIMDICHGPPVHTTDCECIYPTLQNDFYCDGKILDSSITLLEYFGYLYKLSPYHAYKINDMINETIKQSKLVPPNYEFTFVIRDLTVDSGSLQTLYPIPQ